MKIAIDISQIVYKTGVSRYTEELVKSLVKIDSKNQYLLFGTSLRQIGYLKSFQKKFENSKNVSFKIFPFPLIVFEILFNKIHFFPIEKLIGNFDVLHTSDWVEPKVSTKNIKKLTTIHDAVPYLFPTTLPKRVLKNQKRRLNLVKKESDKIIAVSETTGQDIIKFLEVPQEKVKVIYSASESNFKPQSEEKINDIKNKFKIKTPYILSVGTQEPRKNIPKLIDSFEEINKTNTNITLVLVGKYGWGPHIDPLPNVIQTGFVTEEELICLYAGCRVFVYPSLYEGFGLPILEAMACGAPIITSNNSSMAEIGKDVAILVDPRNETQMIKAINFVLNLETDNYQKMVRASLDRARKYSWLKTAKETLQVYQELYKSAEIRQL